MDASPNREAEEQQGAVGPEGPQEVLEIVGVVPSPPSSGSGERWNSDEESTDEEVADDQAEQPDAPAEQPPPPPSPERTVVHHYHHFHCPEQPCSSAGIPHLNTGGDQEAGQILRHLTDQLFRAVTGREPTANHRRNCPHAPRPAPAYRHSSPPRRNRSPSPHWAAPRRERSRSARRSRWEEVLVLSPPRRARRSPPRGIPPEIYGRYSGDINDPPREFIRGIPQGIHRSPVRSPPLYSPPRRAAPPHRSTPPRRAAPPRRSTPPQRTTPPRRVATPRRIHPSPNGSPTSLGNTLRGIFTEFNDETRLRTRNFFIYSIIQLRECFPNLSSVGGWRRFVQTLVLADTFRSQADISLAWNIAFEQPTQAHFTSLWNRDIEELENSVPPGISTSTGIVRF